MSFNAPVARRNDSERLDRVDLGQSAPWRLAHRTRPGTGRALRRRVRAPPARPASSALFLAAFIGPIGSAPTSALPPARSRVWVNKAGAVAPSNSTRAPCPAQPLHQTDQRGRLGELGVFAESIPGGRGQLSPNSISSDRPPFARNISVSQRQRRMRDVRAANVEQPGEIVRIADQQPVVALQRLPDPRDLGGRRFRRRTASCAV